MTILIVMKALCLSGGGAKGVFQIGVLKNWLENNHDIDYDIMVGVSVGAINVAGLALNPRGHLDTSVEHMTDFWLNRVDTSHVYKKRFPLGNIQGLWMKSIYDASPLRKLLYKSIDPQLVAQNGRKIGVGAVCLDTGEHFYAREDDERFVDWVLASASYPTFLTPIEINGKLWADGEIKHVTPIGQAIRLGATEIDVIMCSNFEDHKWLSSKKVAFPDMMIRTLDIMSEKIIKADIEFLKLKNQLAKHGDTSYREVTIRVIMPKKELISNPLDFNKRDIARMFDIGYSLTDTITLRY